ncbi:hypothetical protein [Aquimarina sp. 2201CG14-23]|uniref:hypothetical protein n=1 Tax=Aquimarina mycalae TaxID=3040073 RepID=UPI0024782E2C|nr:hypothetical protein [Aquimarina sp. 2201CG14-23]MDH7445347.1 hypothetical protein [Aquimarina sp. 2201CG14-23]
MRKILQFLFLVMSPVLFAQLPQSLLKPTKRISTFDEYDGSIYKTLRYKQASVIDEKSGTFDAKLRYNTYADALEFKKSSNIFELVKSPTAHARIDGDYYYYCEFRTQRGLKRHGYYVLVELNERYRIYKKYSAKIIDPEKRGSASGTATPGKVQTITKYYLEERGVIMELPMNKKEILSTLGDKEEELKIYIKKEKIKVRKEEDLIRLVSRYNALKSSDTQSRSLLSTRSRRD